MERATWIQSEMNLDALRHACDSLDYLRLIKNQSILAFCAVPSCVAIATLALCFVNPDLFQRSVAIRKAEAVRVWGSPSFNVVGTDQFTFHMSS